jgi:macrolide-specific efflux system membrane fusion protein
LVRYGAQILFDQVPEGLLYGQSATVAVITQAAEDVLYVPSTAVKELPDGRGVVTVKRGGQLVRREVDLGLRGDATTEIRSGVEAGEEVLSSGQ